MRTASFVLNKKDLHDNIVGFCGIILYRALLDFSYSQLISPAFIYTGLVDESNVYTFVFSWLILLAFIPIIVRNYKKNIPSANIVTLLALVCFVPSTSLIAFFVSDFAFIYLIVLYWGSFFFFYRFVPRIKTPLGITSHEKGHLIIYIALMFCAVVLYISGRYTGFRLNFSLTNIYDLRFESREYDIPIVLNYIMGAAENIIPLLVVYYLCKKRYIIALSMAFVILLNFGIGGHKSVFFKLFICFLGYWLYNERWIYRYTWAFIALCVSAFVEKVIWGTLFVGSIIINRAFYIPAQLHYYYYDFFSTRELDYYRQGFLSRFHLSSPYDTTISFLISDVYFDAPESNANNGLFSDAYYNMGIIGCIVQPFILIVIFKLIDGCSVGLNSKMLLLPIVVCFTAFSATTFSGALLTNGVLLMMFVLCYIPRVKEVNA